QEDRSVEVRKVRAVGGSHHVEVPADKRPGGDAASSELGGGLARIGAQLDGFGGHDGAAELLGRAGSTELEAPVRHGTVDAWDRASLEDGKVKDGDVAEPDQQLGVFVDG